MMSNFVESLRRLFLMGKIKEEKIESLYEGGKLTEKEKNYILNKE